MNFYMVDAKTGKNRGSVVMDPFDDISVEEVYPDNHCGECSVWLADAEGGAECDACIANMAPKYVIHIPTGCCYPLEPDGKTVIISGAHLTPEIDGKVFWKYSYVYFEKEVVPTNPFHEWED